MGSEIWLDGPKSQLTEFEIPQRLESCESLQIFNRMRLNAMHTSYGQGLEKTKDAGLHTAPWLKQVQKKYSKQGDLTTITYLEYFPSQHFFVYGPLGLIILANAIMFSAVFVRKLEVFEGREDEDGNRRQSVLTHRQETQRQSGLAAYIERIKTNTFRRVRKFSNFFLKKKRNQKFRHLFAIHYSLPTVSKVKFQP